MTPQRSHQCEVNVQPSRIVQDLNDHSVLESCPTGTHSADLASWEVASASFAMVEGWTPGCDAYYQAGLSQNPQAEAKSSKIRIAVPPELSHNEHATSLSYEACLPRVSH